MRGVFRSRPLHKEEQFLNVNDQKLRMSLIALSDKYNEKIRDMIYAAYRDPLLAESYRKVRTAGIYDKGGKSKTHRKVFEFPNGYVFDFVDAVLRGIYGPDWLNNKRAWHHELIKPWWVVSKI